MSDANYKKLNVWNRSMELVTEIYKITEHFPKSEIFGLTSQMRRAAVSVPSNIAEGSRRMGKKEKRQFYLVAFGSGAELETQIEVVKRLPFSASLNFKKLDTILNEVMRMLNKLISSVSS